jgi:ABC-type uncharacterized transport system ATPase subunit
VVNLTVDKTPAAPGEVVLEVKDLVVGANRAKPVVDHLDLAVRAGEIVGIAGVAGNGQNELIEALSGLNPPDSGRVEICGKDVTFLDVERHRSAGLAYVPEDRAVTGAARPASAEDNLVMGFHRKPPFARGALIDKDKVKQHALALIARFGVKIGNETVSVGTLSGGNLQKVVIARELTHQAPLLIAEQPTRGVDVGAIEFIHAELVAERDRGRAVLLISAELSEVLALSDRILVMYEGRILAEVPAAEASEERLGLLMAGRTPEAA